MLKTGAQHLQSLRDGRVVYVGDERIDDVTTHPAFRNAARSVAAIYDMKADPANREAMTIEADGDRHSAYFLQARTQADLVKRFGAHKKIADLSYGLLGRSPDHVTSFVTGMSLKPEVFGAYADNLTAYYRHMRDNDIYAAYAVVPPQAARNPEFYQRNSLPIPTLHVVREDADGVVISGMKMLATGAVLANEVWIGNLVPLAPDQLAQSITCAIPCNAPGLSLWSRKSFEQQAQTEFENPLAHRFDETDSMLLCDEVKVPWSRVFVHNDAILARNIYIQTAGHAYGNHQSNVRYLSKMQLIVGLASRVTQSSGADQVPAVRETLGRLAALEATLAGLIAGQLQSAEAFPTADSLCPNRRFVYAALNWCTENNSAIIDQLREFCGGSVFQMPADISVLREPVLKQRFETYWASPQMPAVERMKLFKAGLGPGRLRVRRAAPAIREVLRRRFLRGAQLQPHARRLGPVARRGGRAAGELRRARGSSSSVAAQPGPRRLMPDSLGFRLKLGIIAPSTNTTVQPEMEGMRPYGVTNHFGRVFIPDSPVTDDASFNRMMDNIRGSMDDAVASVVTCHPDRLVLGMSSETFWDGLDGSKRLAARMEALAGRPVTVGSDAVQAALAQYPGVRRLGIITPYMPVGDAQVRRFFTDCGFEVVAIHGLRCASPAQIAHVPETVLRDATIEMNGHDVDAIVQVGTNLAMARLAAVAEFWLGKPVLAINTAIYWHALRHSGIADRAPGFGSLLLEH